MTRFRNILFTIILAISGQLFAREAEFGVAAYDGVAILGYVDRGAFLNFTGPNLNVVKGYSRYILGMLPSLRFKTDHGEPRNSFVTPNLGIGFTYCYKYLAFQVPLYYNAKTTDQNGRWHLGLGVGLRFNELIKRKKDNEEI